MNLDLCKEKLIEKTASRFEWNDNSKDDSAVLYCDAYIKPYKDFLRITVTFTKAGVNAVEFCFDEINYGTDALKLVNAFNYNVNFYKAYICTGRKTFLTVVYDAFPAVNETNAVENVITAIDRLNADNVVKYLQPLSTITE